MFSIVFIFTSLVLASDTFTGRVVDSFGNPIYGVNIEVLNSNSGSSTDIEGYFIIDTGASNSCVGFKHKDFFKLEKIRAHRLRHREIKFKFYNLQTQFTKP